ncbi:exosome complex component RRP43-like [Leptidea sinapis]|uniref:Ribosomal RNA-processing protein 43 n=1 Tax=Leptidea sinapis TaxID=189913 RepID=A0A5E4RA27_9NEOP|nr:exosome complex component RRP43-like [Leptidea sinapis]VVD06064.1 unnamed protein product [Leptidea sinapis]
MTDAYKIIHPNKYFEDYISCGERPDERGFSDHRSLLLSVHSIKTAEASAVLKCGNTAAVCGISLELATPKAEEPDNGFLVINVEMTPLCSSKFRPGPPSDQAQVISTAVNDVITNSKCIDLKDLCIVSDKLAWVVYCDVACIDNDGSVIDACIVTLMASLKTLTLPTVSYDVETEEIKVDPTVRIPLKMSGLPVATSFAIYQTPQRNILLSDPTSYEEDMCGGIGTNLIVCWNEGLLCGVQKFGGSNISTEDHKELFRVSKMRSEVIREAIITCITGDTEELSESPK